MMSNSLAHSAAQSPHRHTATASAPTTTPAQSGPQWLVHFVFLYAFTMGFAFIEPSPSDILLCCLTLIMLLFWRLSIDRVVFSAYATILVFLITNIIPFAYVRDAERSLEYTLISVLVILNFVVAYSLIKLFGRYMIEIFFHGVIYFSILASLLSVLSLLSVIPSYGVLTYYGHRALGFFKGPNVFGSFIVFPLLLLIFSYKDIRLPRVFDYIRYPGILILLSGLVASGSRGAWLNAFVASGICLMFSFTRRVSFAEKYKTALLIVTVGLVTMASALFVLSTNYGDFLGGRVGLQSYDTQRFDAQSTSLKAALKQPLGIGPGQTETLEGTASIITDRGPVSVHSLYVRVLVENGWLGAGAVALFVLLTVRRGWASSTSLTASAGLATVATAAFVGTILNSFVIDTLHWRHFWLQAGLLWGFYFLRSVELAATDFSRRGQQRIVQNVSTNGWRS